MWFFLIKAIAGGIIGNATASWFRDTKLGVWFYNKIDSLYNWAAKRYHVKLLTDEEKQMKKFPALSESLAEMDKRLKVLEK
jgi:flagellar biosynthesis/type III secretory pathway ATPase